MTAKDKVFSGSIPEIYDRLLVPMIFEPYARDLTSRITRLAPHCVLEIAAGTGVVTRALAAELPPATGIVATDLNQPMLDHARKRLAHDGRIEWKQADALALPFDDGRFDVVTCQFGAMFFPDKVQAYREAHRVLKAGGHFLFNVWDRIADSEFADMITQALAELFPDDPPRFLARTPHGYCDEAIIRAELREAGFASVSIDVIDAVSRAGSAHDASAAYCQGTPLRNEIEAHNGSIEDATRHAADALARRFGDGAVEGRIRALIIETSK